MKINETLVNSGKAFAVTIFGGMIAGMGLAGIAGSIRGVITGNRRLMCAFAELARGRERVLPTALAMTLETAEPNPAP